MIEQTDNTSRELELAQRALEQAKAKLQKAKTKEAEKKRKEDAHNKIVMGGIVKKYFPECVLFTEEELNEILSKALRSADCRQAIQNIKLKSDSVSEQGNAQEEGATDES